MAIRIRCRVLLLSLVLVAMLSSVQSLAVAQNPHLVVNTYRLNVRSGPGASHSIIDTVAGGTVLPVISLRVGSDWIEVESPSGPGWVNSVYTVDRGNFSNVPNQWTPANLGSGTAIPAGAPHVVVNTSYLNVRTGPGVANPVLVTVKGGTNLLVTAIDGGGVWYQVETSAGSGWINSTYAVTRGSFSNVPRGPIPGLPTNLATGATNMAPGTPHLVVNTSFLNVRTGPGAGHYILTVVKGGTNLIVTAIDSGGVWYQVETSAGTGWVNSNYTVARGNIGSISRSSQSSQREGTHLSGTTPRAVVNTAFLNIRSGAGANNSIIATVPGGTVLRVLGLSRGHGWYLVEGSFGQGWLNNDYTVFRGDFSQVRVVN